MGSGRWDFSLARRRSPLSPPFSTVLLSSSFTPYRDHLRSFPFSDSRVERWEKYMGDRDLDRAYKTCPRRSAKLSRESRTNAAAPRRSVPFVQIYSIDNQCSITVNRWYIGSINPFAFAFSQLLRLSELIFIAVMLRNYGKLKHNTTHSFDITIFL